MATDALKGYGEPTPPALQITRFRSPPTRAERMTTLTAVRCAVCAEQAPLSTAEPVAGAELATFISAHANHDRLAIEMVVANPQCHEGAPDPRHGPPYSMTERDLGAMTLPLPPAAPGI